MRSYTLCLLPLILISLVRNGQHLCDMEAERHGYLLGGGKGVGISALAHKSTDWRIGHGGWWGESQESIPVVDKLLIRPS